MKIFSIDDTVFSPTEKDVVTETRYGCRFPDGSIVWDQMQFNKTRTFIKFELVAKPPTRSNTTREAWVEQVRDRAIRAKVDPDKYLAQHKIVSRTVIFIATEPDEVAVPSALGKEAW